MNDKELIKRLQDRGDACTCCNHSSGYSWCPVCWKKTTKTDQYGGCFRCGETLITKGRSGLVRMFGEKDREWKQRLEEHQIEVKANKGKESKVIT